MATSSILAWRIPWTKKPSRAIVHGVAKSRTQLKQLSTHTHTHTHTHVYALKQLGKANVLNRC